MDITYLLKTEHFRANLKLSEQEDLILLTRGSDVLATFSSTNTTLEAIHSEADKYIQENKNDKLAT